MNYDALIDEALRLTGLLVEEVELDAAWLVDSERVRLLESFEEWANAVTKARRLHSGTARVE